MSANTTDANPRGPNQPTNSDRRTIEARAGERERDGHHPDDGEGEEREDDVLPHEVFERGRDHRGAEQEPDEQ